MSETWAEMLIDEFFRHDVEFSALLFGAIGGAIARSLVWPERGVKRLLQQGAAGIIVAIMGGGYFASLLPYRGESNLWPFLLVGLTLAITGELGVKAFQERGDRLLGRKRAEDQRKETGE